MSEWDAAVAGWAAWCRSAGHSEGTIRFRSKVLRQFAAAAGVGPWQVTLADVVRWLGRPGLAPEYRRFCRGALRSFYRCARDMGHVDVDPTERAPRVRIPETAPRPTPDDVFDRALARATDRDRLVLMLAAYAGLRRAEIAGLRWDAIAGGRVRVRGKGGRVRVVPLHPVLAGELTAEHARRDAGGSGSGYRYGAGLDGPWVFPGQRRGPMTAGAVGVAASGALGAGWTAHTLRHRFATRAYAGTRDLLALQQLLGHASPDTTTRYARASAAALDATVRAAGG